ncbi:MAG: FAD-linked oxidase C-terminal domain-containing protein [Betaproteobacteria bacterium]
MNSQSRNASPLAARLARETRCEVLFDAASRGRYSTDASIYQIEPVGVVVPRSEEDAATAIAIAAELGVPVLPRGAGSSQCGQTVGAALVIDNSKYLNEVVAIDAGQRIAIVQPGVVLDQLNAALKPHGLWYPVDVSTSAQATLGGMAGNNSCGSRSIRYGNMVHNVAGIDALLADGTSAHFGMLALDAQGMLPSIAGPPRWRELVAQVQRIARREAGEIRDVWPKLLRRVGGYNLDLFDPQDPRRYDQPAGTVNLAHLLVGSEGTLAYSRQLHLKLQPLPAARVLGVVNFPTFYKAMESAQHIVRLDPSAVELVDRTMIDLARANPAFRPVIDRALTTVDGDEPEAILLVEFAGDSPTDQLEHLARLVELMGDLGLPGSVVEMTDPAAQRSLWEVRKAGLNIMMSMKGDGKPVSFIEDCAVPLEHLAEYTRRLTEVFTRNGTRGTWYAHASVGTLHVRPILDMRNDSGAKRMRAIAEEAAALVREYKGAYSGEHGDGLVRSEWIAPFFGPRLTRAFEDIKAAFDPRNLMNPGKIVRPSQQTDRSLFRFPPGYRILPMKPGLDWSAWNVHNDPATEALSAPGTGGDPALGLGKAVEMCNNNGHCRKFDAGTMCPSFRATGDEQHTTRGRANTLRLALSGQLGSTESVLASTAVQEALALCVGCKGCKRECPTGIDMARMKIEAAKARRQVHGLALRERLVAGLPVALHSPLRRRLLRWGGALRNASRLLATIGERLTGVSARRSVPIPTRVSFLACHAAAVTTAARESAAFPERSVLLFVDTFTNHFEPWNATAAKRVLEAGGYVVHLVAPAGARPLCCGRTLLAAGMVEEAQREASRMLAALRQYVEAGIPVIGLEPSCLFTLRDEFLVQHLGEAAPRLAALAFTFEEFLARELDAGRLVLPLGPLPQEKALLHGHCHQKAFDAVTPIQKVLNLVPGLTVELIESSCCGMAGAFGFEAEHFDVSMKMGELSLLPAVRAAAAGTLIIADGTSCRHQIHDGAQREAVHVARALERALVER